MDTVHPVGTLRTTRCGSRATASGTGSYDMKAGIYLALSALATVARPGDTRLPVDFLVVPDEETGSHASRAHIERHAANAKYALVCEPARANGGKCVTARKGTGMLNPERQGPSGARRHEPRQGPQRHPRNGAPGVGAGSHDRLRARHHRERGHIAGGTVTNTVPAHCRCVVDFRVPDMGAAEDCAACASCAPWVRTWSWTSTSS